MNAIVISMHIWMFGIRMQAFSIQRIPVWTRNIRTRMPNECVSNAGVLQTEFVPILSLPMILWTDYQITHQPAFLFLQDHRKLHTGFPFIDWLVGG